jgi:hypothetical protein
MKQLSKLQRLLPVIAASCSITLQSQLKAQAESDDSGKSNVEYALILPDEKAPELVKTEDRNPFQAGEDTRLEEVTNTEQNNVRDLLLALPVVGVSPTANGIRVLLGDIRLEEGMEVPAMIPNQTVRLRVNSITPEGIELFWVERKQTGLPPVPLHIPIDIGPRVSHMLPGRFAGDSKSGGGDRTPSMGVWQPPATVVTTNNARRASVVKEEAAAPASAQGPGASVSATPETSKVDPASALLQMFFPKGGQQPAAK